MQNDVDDFFWPSYVDLFVTLFFVGLVLFVLAYLQKEDAQALIEESGLSEEEIVRLDSIMNAYEMKLAALDSAKRAQDVKVARYEELRKINEDIRRVMDNPYFEYRKELEGYRLNVQVEFEVAIDPCTSNTGAEIPRRGGTRDSLIAAGRKIVEIIDTLRRNHSGAKFMLVVAGRSSVTSRDMEVLTGSTARIKQSQIECNYRLSYRRAMSLNELWKSKNIDFESSRFEDFVDLHVAGNGFGGAGRYPRVDEYGNYDRESERKNQGFVVEIVPKIGELLISNQ